jgi:hypothetical protein
MKDSDLLESVSHCLVCHDEGVREKVVLQQKDPDIWFLRCDNCKACSASRMPTEEFLTSIYGRFYENEEQALTFRGFDRMARHIFHLLPQPQKISRILDFGGGSGEIALEIAKLIHKESQKPIEIYTVDYATPIDSTLEGVSIKGLKDLSQAEGQFDVVIASAIFEHIPSLYDSITGLLPKIGPGGFFYARTPFALPITRIVPSYDTFFPVHVHDLGSEFWNKFTKSFAVDLKYIRSSPSIVESKFTEDPFRTLAAYLMKFPAQFEIALSSSGSSAPKNIHWPFVGGWEVGLLREG